jgi:hypothetical protein
MAGCLADMDDAIARRDGRPWLAVIFTTTQIIDDDPVGGERQERPWLPTLSRSICTRPFRPGRCMASCREFFPARTDPLRVIVSLS